MISARRAVLLASLLLFACSDGGLEPAQAKTAETASATVTASVSIAPTHSSPANSAAPPPTTPPGRIMDTAALERASAASPIAADEVVALFPSHGARTDAGGWQFEVHGWIYEPEEDSRIRAKILDEICDTADVEDEASRKIVRSRAGMFLVDNESGKDVSVVAAGRVFSLPASSKDGHFVGTIELGDAEARAWADASGLIEIQAVTRASDPRRFKGRLVLVEPEGLTILSDVDDTIKITEVTKPKQMMRRTFAMPFEAVPGMSDVYVRWSKSAKSAHLHFVSSSPWQLFAPLDDLVAASGFPSSTFDLKRIRPKDVPKTVSTLLADPLTTKPPAIRAVMDRFPKRMFVLVGDSGEKDPEVYGILARERPRQITGIYIRDVTGERKEAARYRDAFDGVSTPWSLFTDPSALPAAP